MIKVEEAKELTYRQEVYHQHIRNKDKTPLRARVNGKCKLWKRSPERFEVPIKHGLYNSGYITETNKEDWCLTEDDAMLHPLRHFGDWNLYTNKTGLRPTKFICNRCSQMKHIPLGAISSYAIDNDREYLLCFECADAKIKEQMIRTGKITLYWNYATQKEIKDYYDELVRQGKYPVLTNFIKITSFTGIMFRAFRFYETQHNWHHAKKTHVWFLGPDGFIWYGFHIGNNNTILHCRRTKKTKF
jgi:hypothetical protein